MAKGGGGGEQTQTVTVDPATQAFVEGQLRPAATEAAGVATGQAQPFFGAADPAQLAAQQQLQGLSQEQLQQFFGAAGGAAQNLGLAATPGLGGIEQFFDPFQQQVISGVQSDFDRQRQLASTSAAQQATQAGAFGGSRGAVLESLGQADVGRRESQALAQIRSGGFQNAAQQLAQQRQLQAQLGFGGLGALGQGIGLGQGLAGQQFIQGGALRDIRNQQSQEDLFRQQQRLGFLGQGIGPFGQSGSQQQGGGSLLGGIAGGALAGSAFGAPGAIVGGGLGLLGGLFG